MKLFRYLLAFLAAATTFVSCEEEEIIYALGGLSAPSNLGAVFNISDDDTGTVTVTPTGVGASSFNIFWGDVANETPTVALPGDTVTKVYAEGEFVLRIVAVGPTGLTSELSRVVTISFTPPSNLDFNVEISQQNPFEVSVSPSADNAAAFDIFWGDVAEEVPTTIMASETATHIYAEIGEYVVRVVARSGSVNTIESTQTINITGASAPLGLPITFDDANINYAFSTFNGASYAVEDNPDTSGANPDASKVGAITNSGNNFEGGAFDLDNPVDFSTDNKTISMKFWSTVAVPVLLKFEGGVNGERQNEVTANHGGTGWEVLTFNFGEDAVKSFIDGSQGVGEPFVPEGQYATMVIFVDGPGTTAGTFYLDDIELLQTALAAPQLPLTFESAEIDYTWIGFGAADFGPIPAGVIDNPDASGINTSSKVVEIIKTAGAQVWAGASINLDGPIDFSAGTTIEVKVWSPKSGAVIKLKLEDSTSPPDGGGNPTVFIEVDVPTTTSNAWELLSFDLTNPTVGTFDVSTNFDRLVLFPDFNVGGSDQSFYFDDIQIAGSGELSLPQLPVNFEASNIDYAWTGFGAADFGPIPAMVIDNPDMSGINTSAKVTSIEKTPGAQPWGGATLNLAGPIDFSGGTTVTMKVWSPRTGTPFLFKIEDTSSPADGNGNPTVFAEVQASTTVANAWEELSFDMTAFGAFSASINYDRLAVFPDFNTGGSGDTFYIDDIAVSAGGGGGGGDERAEVPSFTFENAVGFSGVFESGDGVTGQIITNPDASGINTSANVYEFNKVTGAAWYSGIFHIFDTDIDFSAKTTFSIKIWSPKAGINVRMQLEKEGGGGGATVSVDQTLATANTWVTLTYEFDGLINPADAYDKIVIYPDFDSVNEPAGDGSIYYIDDVVQQ